MKPKVTPATLLLAGGAFALATLSAAQTSPPIRGEAKAMVAGKAVSVDYGSPALQGRDMLGQAQPGTPWRMGRDAATTLVTEADLTAGSATLPKGRYTLTAIKDDKGGWTMIATSTNEAKTKTMVPLTTATAKESIEVFTITLTGKGNDLDFAMAWGTARLSAKFTGK